MPEGISDIWCCPYIVINQLAVDGWCGRYCTGYFNFPGHFLVPNFKKKIFWFHRYSKIWWSCWLLYYNSSLTSMHFLKIWLIRNHMVHMSRFFASLALYRVSYLLESTFRKWVILFMYHYFFFCFGPIIVSSHSITFALSYRGVMMETSVFLSITALGPQLCAQMLKYFILSIFHVIVPGLLMPVYSQLPLAILWRFIMQRGYYHVL